MTATAVVRTDLPQTDNEKRQEDNSSDDSHNEHPDRKTFSPPQLSIRNSCRHQLNKHAYIR